MSPLLANSYQQHMGGAGSPPCCSPCPLLVCPALFTTAQPRAQAPRPCHPSPNAHAPYSHPKPRPCCACVSFSFACRQAQHEIDSQKILRRGGVDIFIGPPHKWFTPGPYCPARTKILGESQNKALRLAQKLFWFRLAVRVQPLCRPPDIRHGIRLKAYTA